MRRAPAWTLAAALALAYVLIAPPSADLAAAEFRAGLFEREGFALWNGAWYGGHHVPAYSVLFPPLAALLGPRLAGALAAVAATWCFERLVAGRPGARAAALWFGAGCGAILYSGRLTFALGVALALGALFAVTRGRTLAAVALALLTGLASPVAAAFLALALAAWWIADAPPRPRLALVLGLGALVPPLAVAVAFPEGGTFPFAASAFWPALAGALAVLALLPREQRVLRIGVTLYSLVLVGAFLFDTPVGGNASRLGALAAGAVLALALPRRRRMLIALAPVLLYWQWAAPVDDVVRAAGDRSVNASYYTGLRRFLGAQRDAQAFRVEVPFTDNHWESAHLAPHFPLARGWERQVDRKVNGLFYDDGPLSAARYRRWLDDNAVRFVALHDAPMDYSAAAEAALIRSRPSYLREVWRDAHWRVFEYATAAAPISALRSDSVVLDLAPGRAVVRVRYTPYWAVVEGSACVERAGDWTAVTSPVGGRVVLATRFALRRIRADRPRCTPGR